MVVTHFNSVPTTHHEIFGALLAELAELVTKHDLVPIQVEPHRVVFTSTSGELDKITIRIGTTGYAGPDEAGFSVIWRCAGQIRLRIDDSITNSDKSLYLNAAFATTLISLITGWHDNWRASIPYNAITNGHLFATAIDYLVAAFACTHPGQRGMILAHSMANAPAYEPDLQIRDEHGLYFTIPDDDIAAFRALLPHGSFFEKDKTIGGLITIKPMPQARLLVAQNPIDVMRATSDPRYSGLSFRLNPMPNGLV